MTDTPTNAVDLDRLEKLLAEATPGPWSWWPSCVRVGGMITQDGNGTHIAAPTYMAGTDFPTHANAKLMAASRTAIPSLIATIRRQCEALRILRGFNVDIQHGRINYRPEDHIDVIDAALRPAATDAGDAT